MRTDAINSSLADSISVERLDKYLSATKGDLSAAIGIYERNSRLSESFYSSLQCMEVCLRNKLCGQMERTYGSGWLQSAAAPLAADAIEKIGLAVRAIAPHPVTPGRIIAELSFGFWVGLLGPRYDETLWRKSLHLAFRAHGAKRRAVVHGRFNALRRFRNRIAHHEPIFQKPLPQLHEEVLEAVSWMCAHTSAWARHQSSFDRTYYNP